MKKKNWDNNFKNLSKEGKALWLHKIMTMDEIELESKGEDDILDQVIKEINDYYHKQRDQLYS